MADYYERTVSDLLDEAVYLAFDTGTVSTSMLQRRLKIGFGKAVKIIEEMERLGVVGASNDAKPRNVIMTREEWSNLRYNIDICDTFESSYKSAETDVGNEIYKADLGYNDSISKDTYDDTDSFNYSEKLDNYVFPNSSDAIQTAFIKELLSSASPKSLEFVLIDASVCYSEFNGSPNLLMPVLTDEKKIEGAILWLENEQQYRIELLSYLNYKTIEEYNAQSGSNSKLPYILLIVNEAYQLLPNNQYDKPLLSILLKSKTTGLYCFFFSKFSLKNLSLGIKTDLLKVGDTVDLKKILAKDPAPCQSTIDDIDSKMDGHGFETFCGDILRKNGFNNIVVTQSSGDYGADIIAIKDEVKYAIQCKKYNAPVGISAIQEVIASKTIYNCHVACVLTNSTFTPAAVELANKNIVLLWDRNKLKELLENTID